MSNKQHQAAWRRRQRQKQIHQNTEYYQSKEHLKQAHVEIKSLESQITEDSDTRYNNLLERFNVLKDDYLALETDNAELQNMYGSVKAENVKLNEQLKRIGSASVLLKGQHVSKLSKQLSMLGSEYENERSNAAVAIEKWRKRVNMSWIDILKLINLT